MNYNSSFPPKQLSSQNLVNLQAILNLPKKTKYDSSATHANLPASTTFSK
ncbi:hypothetical protein [Streptococcus cuniculipharyngis]